MFAMTKTIFWDFDGTLIHPNESFLDSIQIALKSCGYDVNASDIRDFLRRVCSWNTPEIEYTDRTGQKWWDSLFHQLDTFYRNLGVSGSDKDKLNELFKKRAIDPATFTLYPDSVDVLGECISLGYRNYIISNNFPDLSNTIEGLGLSTLFSGYIVSSNVGYEKPRIEIFRYALTVAGFPDVFYMVGDNPVADIHGAKNAGMKTILVHRDIEADCDYHCDALSEIPPILT